MTAFTDWLESIPRRGAWIEHCRIKPPSDIELRCLDRKRHREAERTIRN